MMKHPRFRVRDVLVLEPAVRDEIYDFIRAAVAAHLPAWVSPLVHEVQHVGSLTWGGARLSSDVDFNIALRRDVSWADYVNARRWFYSPSRGDLARACMQFQLTTGLKIDVGMIDVEAERYNTFVSLSEMVLHHRTTQFLTEFENGDAGPIVDVEDVAPIDLATFDPAVDELPPSRQQHLKWDGYGMRWRTVIIPLPQKRASVWVADEWADEVPEWRARYGQHFIETREEDGRLVEDVPA